MTTTQLELRATLPTVNIGDPVYRFMTERLRMKLSHAITLMVLINFIRVVLIPILHHQALGSNFFANMNPTDVQYLVISFITQPIILYVYWAMVDFIPETFISMFAKGVIRQRTGKTVGQFLLDLRRNLTAPKWNWLALAVAVFTVISYQIVGWSSARTRGAFGSYPYTDFQQYGIETVYGLIRFWFLNWAVLRIFLYVAALRDWWQDFEADVKPLHPDKAGGFEMIGDGTLYGGLMIGAVGLYLGSNIIVEIQRAGLVELSILITIAILVLALIPYAFFTPIWSTHKAMERERLRQLHRISEQYNLLWNAMGARDAKPGKEDLEQLETLENLQKTIIRVVPVWPYAREDLGRFGITLAPIWTVSVTFIVQALLGSFFRK